MRSASNSGIKHGGAGEALREFFEQANRAMERRLSKDGVSYARIKMMLYIDRHEHVRSADLVRSFGHAPRTITEGIDMLERDGLAIRTPDETDRRVKKISLTPAGVELLSSVMPTLQNFGEQMFAVLNAEEQSQLAAYLQRMRKQLKEMEEAV